MGFLGKSKFAVLSCSPEVFRGAVFGRRNSRWTLLRSGENTAAGDLPGDRFKALLRELSYSSGDTLLYVTGDLAGSSFFVWDSVEMPWREQRGAVEMELPGAVPVPMEDPLFQFVEFPPDEEGNVKVCVYAFPASSLDQICAMLNRANSKADEFVSPLMGLMPGDPPVRFETINPGFFFSEGCWKRAAGRDKALAEADEEWARIMNELFVLPEGFPVARFLDILLVARLECSGAAIKERPSLRVLPDPARPLRYRTHIQLGVVLLVLLLLNLLWSFYLNYGGEYREARQLAAEIEACRRKTNSIQSRLKRNQKASRDMARVVEIVPGESDVIGKLAAFSRLLPENVLVSSMRWSDSGVDLQLQSENAGINLPVLLKPLTFWKVGNLQQRQMWNSDVTSINLRLVPNTDTGAALENKRKSGGSSRNRSSGTRSTNTRSGGNTQRRTGR